MTTTDDLETRAVRLWAAGDHEEALALFVELCRLAEAGGEADKAVQWLYNVACAQARLGRTGEALAYLTEAVEGGFENLPLLRRDTDLDALRDEPAFADIAAHLERRLAIEWSEDEQLPWSGVFDAPNSSGFARLREEHDLPGVVDGAGDDAEKLCRIVDWAHAAFEHDSSHQPSRSDPLTILTEAAAGERFRCVEYAKVAAAAATAMGLPGRVLVLFRRDVEALNSAHVVVEAWLPDAGCWAYADPQFGLVPQLRGRPIHAVELRRASLDGDHDLLCRGAPDGDCGNYTSWILPYLWFLLAHGDQRHFGGPPSDLADVLLMPAGREVPAVFRGGAPGEDPPRPVTNPAAFYPELGFAGGPQAGAGERPQRSR